MVTMVTMVTVVAVAVTTVTTTTVTEASREDYSFLEDCRPHDAVDHFHSQSTSSLSLASRLGLPGRQSEST